MTRGRVALLALVGVVVTFASGTQTWLVGTTNDAVLGRSTVTAIGSQAASGAVALAVVVLAAVIAAMVAGRRLRRVISLVGLAAAIGQVVHVAMSALSPADTLGPLAAAAVGRGGSIPVVGQSLTWAWIGLAGAVILAITAALTVVAVGRWPLPTRRYDSPVKASDKSGSSGAAGSSASTAPHAGTRETAGPRGERVRSDWDALSEGHDPTDVSRPPST